MLDVAEDLPPIELVADVVELATSPGPGAGELPAAVPRRRCVRRRRDHRLPRRATRATRTGRCSAASARGRSTGGSTASAPAQVDICPRKRPDGAGAVLTKCCLLETTDRERRRPGRRAVGRLAGPGLRGADRARRSSGSRRGHPSERLRAVRPPVGHAGAGARCSRSALGCRAGWTSSSRWPRPRPGSGIIPAAAAAADRRARRVERSTWTSSPSRRADLALDARPDPGPAAGAARRRPASTSTSAPPCRTSPTPGSHWSCATSARSSGATCGRRGRAARARPAAPRHGDGRPHARAARRADHLRVQGRVLGRRGPPPPGAAARGPRPLAGRASSAVRSGRSGSSAARRRAARRFCAELGLADPGISWLTTRDRVAEFGGVLAMVCGTLARIGNEVYELQRPEIGELREPTTGDAVGSITMPHKRNPEGGEHLDTLARLVRANAAGAAGGHGRRARARRARLEGRVGRAARGLPADRRRAAAGPAPAGGPGGRRRRDAGQPGAARRPARLGADARRADPAAGQARGAAACCTTCSRPGRDVARGRSTALVDEGVATEEVAWPGRPGRWARRPRWSTPSSPAPGRRARRAGAWR